MKNQFLDDLMQVAGGAMNAVSSFRDQMREEVKILVEGFISNADLVRRDEFDVVKDMAEKARLENEALRKELEKLKSDKKKK